MKTTSRCSRIIYNSSMEPVMMNIPARKLANSRGHANPGQLVNEGFDFSPDPMSDFARKQARHTPEGRPVLVRWDAGTAHAVAAGAFLARSEKVADNQRETLAGKIRAAFSKVEDAHADYLAECARQGVVPKYKFLYT